MRKICTITSGRNSIISLMSDDVSVATDAAAATVEFLSYAMSVLPNGATEPRYACGMMICVADCMKLRPIARAASA